MAKTLSMKHYHRQRDLKETMTRQTVVVGFREFGFQSKMAEEAGQLSLLSNLSLLPEGLSLFTSLGSPPEQESGRYCWNYCQVIRKSNGHKMTAEAIKEKPRIKLPLRNQSIWECLCNWQTTKPPPGVGKNKCVEKLKTLAFTSMN